MKKIKPTKFLSPILMALAALSIPSLAQKNIAISEGLAANAEKHSVKMGTQWMGKIWNIRFGEYAVVSSKLGWLTSSSKSVFSNIRTETTSTQKFSLVLSNKTSDSARVNAGSNIMEEWRRVIEPKIDVSVVSIVDGLLSSGPFSNYTEGTSFISLAKMVQSMEYSNFSAFITINGDTTQTWALSMIESKDQHTARNYEGFLSNGNDEILIVKVNSNKNGEDGQQIPALGYEFIENGRSLSALQYYGGGAFGMNKNIVWISNENDTNMKIVLASAMTAVLQIS